MNKLLDLLDEAAEKAEQVSRLSGNETTKDQLEYAIALIREAWIGESGQDTKQAELVIQDVSYAKSIVGLAFT